MIFQKCPNLDRLLHSGLLHPTQYRVDWMEQEELSGRFMSVLTIEKGEFAVKAEKVMKAMFALRLVEDANIICS